MMTVGRISFMSKHVVGLSSSFLVWWDTPDTSETPDNMDDGPWQEEYFIVPDYSDNYNLTLQIWGCVSAHLSF